MGQKTCLLMVTAACLDICCMTPQNEQQADKLCHIFYIAFKTDYFLIRIIFLNEENLFHYM